MRQRIGLEKALEEPREREGEARAMASSFWSTSRNRRMAMVRVLGESRRPEVWRSRRGSV